MPPLRHLCTIIAPPGSSLFLLVAGGLVTLVCTERTAAHPNIEDVTDNIGISCLLGTCLMLTWLVLLVASIAACQGMAYQDHQVLHWFEAFFRIGSLTFGGTQVR